MKSNRILIVSGYSGAGKTYALKYLESLGYYCVDNLPIKLVESFLELYLKDNIKKSPEHIAIGVDIRSTINFDDCNEVLAKLKKQGYTVKLLFVKSEKQVIFQRYQETRNAHPLTSLKRMFAGGKKELSLEDAIGSEISLLEPLRRIADIVIDTSNTNVHELRQQIFSLFTIESSALAHKLMIRVISFGFSKGIPTDIDLMFDVRFLPNPHFDPKLRPLTGKDKAVKDYLDDKKETGLFWNKLIALLDYLVPEYTKEGKSYLSIGIGCTGGRHRSVMISEKIKEHFEEKGYKSIVEHRDIYMPHS
jgi:RNase adapter protein RapZ